jgi:hypothetical protein
MELNNDLVIIDMPGVEDLMWYKEMRIYIEKRFSSILPLFVVDLTQGTFNLD